MSTLKRIAIGSTAAWAKIAVNIATQLLVIPMLLLTWDASTLGLWLAIQALVPAFQILDISFQNFLDGEFLQLPTNERDQFSKLLGSSIPVAILLSGFQFLFVLLAINTNFIAEISGASQVSSRAVFACNLYALLQSLIWVVFGGIGGIVVKMLVPFGYYARMAWWGVAVSGTSFITAIFVCLMNGELIHACIFQCFTNLLVVGGMSVDLFLIVRKENIAISPSLSFLGLKNFYYSLAFVFQNFTDYFKQQGTRLLIAPFQGPAGVASFTTIRTGANIALQGMGTITGPILPELMRYLQQRDQARVESSFSTLWAVLVFVLLPGVIILQGVAEPLFLFWTKDKLTFDPPLFAVCSMTVMFFAMSTPAQAIIRGNNILSVQIIASLCSCLSILGLIAVLIRPLGIQGVAIALLGGEIVSSVLYTRAASFWLIDRGLLWPWRTFIIVLASVLFSAAIIGAQANQSSASPLFMMISLLGLFGLQVVYYLSLPKLMKERFSSFRFFRALRSR